MDFLVCVGRSHATEQAALRAKARKDLSLSGRTIDNGLIGEEPERSHIIDCPRDNLHLAIEEIDLPLATLEGEIGSDRSATRRRVGQLDLRYEGMMHQKTNHSRSGSIIFLRTAPHHSFYRAEIRMFGAHALILCEAVIL